MYLTDLSKPFSFCQNKSVCITPFTNLYSRFIALKSSFNWFEPGIFWCTSNNNNDDDDNEN